MAALLLESQQQETAIQDIVNVLKREYGQVQEDKLRVSEEKEIIRSTAMSKRREPSCSRGLKAS